MKSAQRILAEYLADRCENRPQPDSWREYMSQADSLIRELRGEGYEIVWQGMAQGNNLMGAYGGLLGSGKISQ